MAGMWLSGCMRCSPAEEFESYVDDPTTLEAVRALHDPPDVLVQVTKGPKETAGNMACGHSPVCIILLPAVVEELAFPVHYQNATVKRAGKTSYEAVFHHNDQFFRATARDGNVAREIQFLALSALGRNVVVEVGRAPLDARGKPGKFVKTSVQSQVDLLTPYTKLLSDPKSPNRAVALLEAARVLGDDASGLVEGRLADPKEPAATKTEFFHTMCYPGPSPFTKPGRASDLMRAFAAARPPAPAALAALECCERGPEPRNAALKISLSEARPLLAATLGALGETPTTREFLDHSAALFLWAGSPKRNDPSDSHETKAAIRGALDACKPVSRRRYLAFLFDAPLPEADRRALAIDPEFAAAVHPWLDPNHDTDHALLVDALANVEAKHAEAGLMALHGRRAPPTQAERELLVELYTKELYPQARAGLLGRLVQSSAPEQRALVTSLDQRLTRAGALTAGIDAATPSSAPGESEGYLPERPSDREMLRHAALAALGASAHELPLLRYVARYAICDTRTRATGGASPGAVPSGDAPGSAASSRQAPSKAARTRACGFEPVTVLTRPEEVYSLPTLALYALGLAGCKEWDPAAAQDALATKDSGALCP
ncbi:MAG TPA: hypothetical protein VFU02_22430 [Polyangiaceae bacterium]|nr:hypothetical protein [Polyangiaceae bacterium]